MPAIDKCRSRKRLDIITSYLQGRIPMMIEVSKPFKRVSVSLLCWDQAKPLQRDLLIYLLW